MTLIYRCTAAQRATLVDSFFPGGGGGGGVWFDFPHPLTGATVQARFLVGKEPQTVAVPPKFDVTVVLEVTG